MSVDLESACERGRHNWGKESFRGEKTCFTCLVTMTAQQIALIVVEPEPKDLKTMYEGMGHGPGGMAGTSVVYENGIPLERTRRECVISYTQYENLKKMGRIQ